MRVAVIGAGVSGLTAAYACATPRGPALRARAPAAATSGPSRSRRPTARSPWTPGSSSTTSRPTHGSSRLLAELGVATQPSDMSLGVAAGPATSSSARAGARGFFAQRRRWPSGRPTGGCSPTSRGSTATRGRPLDARVADAGDARRLPRRPAASARRSATTSSCPSRRRSGPRRRAGSLDFPVDYLLRFLDNHGLIGFGRALQWRTVGGGSRTLRRAASSRPARGRGPRRRPGRRPSPRDAGGCDGPDRGRRRERVRRRRHRHARRRGAALLRDADPAERSALGGFDYTATRSCSTPTSASLPRRRGARGRRGTSTRRTAPRPGDALTMTYHMNRLQGLPGPTQYFVSVNPGDRRPRRAGHRGPRRCSHPLYTFRTLDGAGGPRRAPGPSRHLVRRRPPRLRLPRGRLPLRASRPPTAHRVPRAERETVAA